MISTEQFGVSYGASFSPTVLFLDGHGKQLADKLIGMNGRDYYGYYLGRSIDQALASINANSELDLDSTN
jgi:hypothetical protein